MGLTKEYILYRIHFRFPSPLQSSSFLQLGTKKIYYIDYTTVKLCVLKFTTNKKRLFYSIFNGIQECSANNLTIAVFAQIEHPHIIPQKFPENENFLENLRNFMSCEYFLKIGTFVLHIGNTFCLFHKYLKKSHHFAKFCERFSNYFATMR